MVGTCSRETDDERNAYRILIGKPGRGDDF
jgi:hypothetical protein